MTNSSPGISVVVPTFRRVSHVKHLLDTLEAAKTQFSGPVEVLIVDDSPTQDAEQISAACRAHSNVEYLRGEASVRKKRNLGIDHARYPIVLFVDSDCEATPNLFNEHAKTYENVDGQLGGVVGVTEFVGRDTWMWRVIQATQFLNAFSFAKRMEYAPWATCTNTSYRTQVLRDLGGFDASFPFKLGGDDVDLGLRLNKANYKIKSNPQALVRHTRETWDSFSRVASKAFRWGRMDLHLYYRKHSERIVSSLPKFGSVFTLLLIVSITQALGTRRLIFLVLPLVWGILSLLFQSLWTVRRAGQPWTHMIYELLADVLGLFFEFGTLWEGLRRFDFSPFYKNVRRGPVLPIFEQQEWLIQHWSMLLSLMIVLLVLPWLPNR